MPVPPRPARPVPGPPVRGAGRPAAPRAARPPRRWWVRWGAGLATTLSVLVLVVGGVGHAVVTTLDTGIGRVEAFADTKNRPAAGRGTNVLLVGTDGRDRVTPAEKARYRLGGAPCNCTDTVMLAHVSEDRRRVSVVSLPRDSYVELPGHADPATGERRGARPVKLNAVHAEGGPGLLVRTVERMTGVKVDHYLEVDFTGFMSAVDALGGVRICTARPMRDPYTGLDLPAGTHVLDGGGALRYVRSRHVDATSDLGRMRRQQRFVAALIDRATGSGVLLDPRRFRGVLEAAAGSVRADRGFGAEEVLELAGGMRGLTAASSEFASVPVEAEGPRVDGVGATVRWDAARARKLFASIREDRPLRARPAGPATRRGAVAVPPGDVRVQVYNGTGIPGLAARMDAGLRAAGFDTTRTPYDAGRRDVARTVVAYDPVWDRSAETLAAALPGARLLAVPGQGPLMRVTAGADRTAVRPVRTGAPTPARGSAGDEALTGDQVVCP
ncbi:LCP family protein [Streptomyces sp. MRC013]|uniref:LCP family protein n=1 Tax=Streptomyces sp. MRC013 TaxID=2898276 RepID=UPI002025C860|nr:LCP family protein [Streptomyces sp. MRC013]URM91162.1 LCP family protein [Streptomyces sp. MRC013]